jgi:ATP-dependent Zn protease
MLVDVLTPTWFYTGMSLGMVMQLPEEDETSVSRRQLLARLDVCMGGRVAEELIFGTSAVTTGNINYSCYIL